MISLILAAGNGTRFAAYPYPKPLLPMPDGRPLIAWACDRLPAGERIIIMREQDQAALAPWIGAVECVTLAHVTNGPLASAWAARDMLYGELLILYCDVVLDCVAFVGAARQRAAPYACVTFTSNDSRYGYWTGEQVVEKQAVSSRAVSGAFYFHDATVFLRRAALFANTSAGIPSLLDDQTFCYHDDGVIDVGTPADYEAFIGVTA